MSTPAVSVVVPTRGRAGYLEVALASLRAQDVEEPYDLLVVDDGARDGTAEVAARLGARLLALDPPGGLNAARNAGARAAGAELVAFVDDDVEAPRGWLRALLAGARRHPDAGALGGPIRARLEGAVPHGCGREEPPVTTLDLGPEDREAELVFGANMLVRRSALERVGWFDEGIAGGGDEEEWLERLRAAGGRVVYVARAGLDHRRCGEDVRLRALVRGAYTRGRAVRRFDRRRGIQPGLTGELRVLAGCAWHTVRRGCPYGIVMGAHSLGRTLEALRRG
jgi:GT2 family glycosyltransferase